MCPQTMSVTGLFLLRICRSPARHRKNGCFFRFASQNAVLCLGNGICRRKTMPFFRLVSLCRRNACRIMLAPKCLRDSLSFFRIRFSGFVVYWAFLCHSFACAWSDFVDYWALAKNLSQMLHFVQHDSWKMFSVTVERPSVWQVERRSE